MTPNAVAVIAGARTVRRYLPRLGPQILVLAGSLLAAGGFAWQAQATPTSSYWPAMLGPELLISFGSGLVLTPVAALMTSAASASDGGIVSGLVNAARQVGGSLGLTVLVTIASSPSAAARAAGPASALAHGYDRSFLAAAVIAALTAVTAAVVLPRRAPARPAIREQGGQCMSRTTANPAYARTVRRSDQATRTGPRPRRRRQRASQLRRCPGPAPG